MRQTSADTFFSDVNTIDPNELLQDEERSTRRHPRGTKITKYLKQFDRALGTPKENSYRKFIWGIFSLNASRYGNRTTYWPSKIFEFIIVLLIGINVCLAVIKTDPNLAGTEDFNNAYSFIIIVSFLIFGLEYGLRCWSCVEDAKYPGACSGRIVWITRPLSILDLIVLIAFMLDAISSFTVFDPKVKNPAMEYGRSISFLRLLRMLTILRIERQSKGLKRLFTVLKRKIPELLITVFVASILLIVASTLIYYVEPETFNTIPEGIWWATQTLTTVGYGDIYPKSSGGRVIGVFVAFLGVCLFALPAGVLGSGLMEIVAEKRHAEEMAKIRKRILNQRKQRERNSNSFVTNGIKGRMQEEEDDDRIPKFSEVFDLDNLEHMKYAASLFCGNTYGYVDSNVWNKYAPEDGGIVGLHAIIANRLTIEYFNNFFMKESLHVLRNSSIDGDMDLDDSFDGSFMDNDLSNIHNSNKTSNRNQHRTIELSDRRNDSSGKSRKPNKKIKDNGTYVQL